MRRRGRRGSKIFNQLCTFRAVRYFRCDNCGAEFGIFILNKEIKKRVQLKKHGIDFETARKIWLDEYRIEIEVPYLIEKRWIVIGAIENKVWTAVLTIRDDFVRIISVRRSRTREKKLYDKKSLS